MAAGSTEGSWSGENAAGDRDFAVVKLRSDPCIRWYSKGRELMVHACRACVHDMLKGVVC